jgi:hypothetical protein
MSLLLSILRNLPRVAAAALAAGTLSVSAQVTDVERGRLVYNRLTTNHTAIEQVVARGWVEEGIVMCAPR